jgi:hypothetical protein
VAYQWFYARQMAAQLTPAGLVLAVAGAAGCRRRVPPLVRIAFAWIWFASSFLLIGLLRFDFDRVFRTVSMVYPLIAYGVLAILAGLGIATLAGRVSTRWPAAARPAAAAAAAALVTVTLAAHAPHNDRRDDTWARDYASTVLASLDADAVLFVHNDFDTGPIGYLHFGEGVRPDVEVYNDQGLVFGNRLFPARASDSVKRDRLRAFIDQTTRPVYYIAPIAHSFGEIDYGLVRKVDRTRPGGRVARADGHVLAYAERVAALPPPLDPWTIDHRDHLLGRLAEALTEARAAGSPLDARIDALDRAARSSYSWSMMRAQALVTAGDLAAAEPAVDAVLADVRRAATKWQRARAAYLKAAVLLGRNEVEQAVPYLEAAVEAYPVPAENGAVLNLLTYYAGKDRKAEYQAVRARAFGRSPVPQSVLDLDAALR